MLKLNTITRNTIICRKEGLETTELNDDIVMMDLDEGKYYALNSTAGAIWDKLQKPMSVSEIIDCLQKEYDIDDEKCYLDTIELLDSLKEAKLITTKEA